MGDRSRDHSKARDENSPGRPIKKRELEVEGDVNDRIHSSDCRVRKRHDD